MTGAGREVPERKLAFPDRFLKDMEPFGALDRAARRAQHYAT